MKEPIRVLHILTKLSFGGVQSVIMNYYRGIDKSKVQFDFVVQCEEEGCYEKEVLALGGRIYRVTPIHNNVILFCRDLLNIFKINPRYKIIHTNQNFLNIIPLMMAKKAKIPCRISHSHSNYLASSFVKELQRKIFRKTIALYATDYFACSIGSAIWLYGDRNAKSNRCKIIHNAIETRKFLLDNNIRGKIRQELEIQNNFVLIHVGMFSEVKNHKYLLEIFRRVYKVNNESTLLLIGDGEKKEELEDLALEYGISNNIIFLGKKENVNEYLMAADCFVFPSKYEGLPLSLIEAEISGLNCFVSDRVTHEADLFGDTTYKSIDIAPEEWADAISKGGINRHKRSFEEIINSGYEINSEAAKLQHFYEDRSICNEK